MYIYELLAIILISICHITLYVYLIGYTRFSWRSLSTVGLLMTATLLIAVSATGYSEMNLIVMLIFLPALGLLKQKDGLTFVHNLYFTFFSLFGITLAKLLIAELLFRLMLLSPFNLYMSTFSLFNLIAAFTLLIFILLLRRRIEKVAIYLVRSQLYYVSYVLLIAGMSVLTIFSSPGIEMIGSLNMHYAAISYQAAVLLFFILLILFAISSHLAKEQVLEAEKQNADRELLSYTEKLEVMHEELASFRHDYINLLLSLDESVRSRDMDQIEQVYHEVIKPSSAIVNDEELDLAKLQRIRIAAVKSILSVKVAAARQKGITIMLDIPFEMKKVAVPLPDFIRMISIILDNAIEGASASADCHMELSFFEMDNTQQFIVRNSSAEEQMNLLEIYEKNHTHKQNLEGRSGYGLFSLKRLVASMSNNILDTSFNSPWFTQRLIMKKS